MKLGVNLLWTLAFSVSGLYAEDKPKNDYTQAQIRPFLEAKVWTVLSLDPDPWIEGTNDPFSTPAPPPGSKEPPPPTIEPKRKVTPDKEFHDYPILGQHTLTVTPEVRLIITDLDRAGQSWFGGVAGCYMPRHGIRVIEGGKNYDLQICYECFTAILFVDSKQVGAIYFASAANHTSTAPNANALNAIFRKAGVKLPPPPRR